MKTTQRKYQSSMIAVVMLNLICLISACIAEPEVKIHYLGHSSFILQFDNGISVQTDYGQSNSYGLSSPIYDIGSFIPDIITYSHMNHVDHYDASRKPEGVDHILTGMDSLDIDGLSIRPVRTCESSTSAESNTSYIFTYKNLKICHLGDAQANIMAIQHVDQQAHIKEIFPTQFDLLLMTIEGVSKFIYQAERFLDLIQSKRVIPMHYWSVAYKNQFLDFLADQNIIVGMNYQIQKQENAQYEISSSDTNVTPIVVVSLEPATFVPSNVDDKERSYLFDFKLYQNYPNPFNANTIIKYYIPSDEFVSLKVYNLMGQDVMTLVHENQNSGKHTITFDASHLPNGVYFYQLKTDRCIESKKLILMK